MGHRHTYNIAGCQGRSPRAAPGARGTGGEPGGAVGSRSGHLKPVSTQDHNTPKSGGGESSALMFTVQRSAFEPDYLFFMLFLSSSWEEQALRGSCIICSEGMVSKERNYALGIHVSPTTKGVSVWIGVL